eukprot:TRINITY_DN1826_c0_g1_i6.p1 TRINITY_DN1826_c0_g1~~TRINITY_DN1826_c0_g1_i6.p1  ORF type:complete len:782 (-),score=188.43 TRINITY_DN1826_c0_g1_i6:545-2770(-)
MQSASSCTATRKRRQLILDPRAEQPTQSIGSPLPDNERADTDSDACSPQEDVNTAGGQQKTPPLFAEEPPDTQDVPTCGGLYYAPAEGADAAQATSVAAALEQYRANYADVKVDNGMYLLVTAADPPAQNLQPPLPPAPAVVSGGSGGEHPDWNTKFQQAVLDISRLTPNTHSEDRLRAYSTLSQLATDFNYAVKTYGRIIISEVNLPAELKTIKPTNVGGIAGGDKYVVQKILFKFALDNHQMYAGDQNAAKVAGHELKSLVQLFNCWEPGIHLPMMATVDYRGFRLTGMTFLPISGEQSIVHGSANGGETVHYDAAVAVKLEKVTNQLNLKWHRAGNEGVLISTPLDLEAHVGADGNMYIIDVSRLFPPQTPTDQRCGHLFQLLRPEFVKHYYTPLCSDAFSRFLDPENQDQARRQEAMKHNAEIEVATTVMSEEAVPAFALKLVNLPPHRRDELPLVVMLHASGINVRCLGRVFNEVENMKDEYWQARILIEMVSRVVKDKVNSLLRHKMRELCQPGEAAYRRVVIERLNVVFGSSEASVSYWDGPVSRHLARKFPPFAAAGTPAPAGDHLRRHLLRCAADSSLRDGRCLLFERISQQLGLRWVSLTWKNATSNPTVFDCYYPFTDTDLQELREIIKEMNIAAHSTGVVLKMQAMKTRNRQERVKLLELALRQFLKALEGNPDNKVTLRNIGDCLSAMDGHDEQARGYYQRAIDADPQDTISLYVCVRVLLLRISWCL